MGEGTASTGRLAGLGVVVTGGGTGIGRACAARLAADGAGVTICGRTESALADAVHLQDLGIFVRVLHANLVGSFLCVKHVVPHLAAGGGGAVGPGTIAPTRVRRSWTPRRSCSRRLGWKALRFDRSAPRRV